MTQIDQRGTPEQVALERERLLHRLGSRRKVRHAALGAAHVDGAWQWTGAVEDANGREPMRLTAVLGHTGSTGSWLWHAPQLQIVIAGTVDQATAASVPFRVVPRALARVIVED
jgi:hypothetical protein